MFIATRKREDIGRFNHAASVPSKMRKLHLGGYSMHRQDQQRWVVRGSQLYVQMVLEGRSWGQRKPDRNHHRDYWNRLLDSEWATAYSATECRQSYVLGFTKGNNLSRGRMILPPWDIWNQHALALWRRGRKSFSTVTGRNPSENRRLVYICVVTRIGLWYWNPPRPSIGVSLRRPLASSRTPLSIFPSDIHNAAPISRLPTGVSCSRLQLMMVGILSPSNVGKGIPWSFSVFRSRDYERARTTMLGWTIRFPR